MQHRHFHSSLLPGLSGPLSGEHILLGTCIGLLLIFLVFSPLIGGAFANPAKEWPEIFGHIKFFHYYPYFLPCFVAALVPLSAFLFAFLGLKEVINIFLPYFSPDEFIFLDSPTKGH